LYDLFVGERADTGEAKLNPRLLRAVEEAGRMHVPAGLRGRGRRGAPQRGPRYRPPSRTEIVDRLDRAGLLPAIVSTFTCAGFAAAVAEGVRTERCSTSRDEDQHVRSNDDERTAIRPPSSPEELRYW